MSKTEVSGKQIKDGSIEQVDLSSALSTDINTLKSDVSTLQTDVAGKASAASLATVATSGSYDDLTDKPTIPSLTAVEGDVAALDTRVTAVEADVASLQGASTPNLSDLGEVSITSPSSGEVLKYNGTGWANAADSSFSGDYDDLSNKPSLFSGSYADLTNKPTIPSALDDLSDVAITSPSNTQVLQYNGTAWVNAEAPAGGGASDLDGLSDVAITSAAKGQFIVHNGTEFVNSRTIEADAAATKALIIKGAASQSANLLELQNSAGTSMISMTVSGAISAKSAEFINDTVDSFPLYVRRPSSHTRPGFAVYDSGWNRLFAVGNDARYTGAPANMAGFIELGSSTYNFSTLGYNTSTSALRLISRADTAISFESPGGAAGIYYLTIARNTTNTSWNFTPSGFASNINFATKVGVNLSAAATAQFQVTSSAAATKGLVVQGAASQTANLFEVQNSAGTTLSFVRPDGGFTIGSASAIGGSSYTAIQSPDAGYKSLVVKAKSDQWNSLFECTDSSNNLRFGVGPSGTTTISNSYNGATALTIAHSTSQTGDLIYASNNAVQKFKVDKDGNTTIGSATGTARIILNGGATNTTDGAAIFCQNNSVNIVGIGAASALGIGAAYDNTPALRSWANGYMVAGLTSGAGTNTMKWDTSTSKWTYDTSSLRYKDNVRDSQYGLNDVMQLQSRQFNYKDSGREDVGLIAEEVVGVIPELVGVNSEGQPDSVSYDRMVSVLIKAIQELKAKNDELEARLAALENN